MEFQTALKESVRYNVLALAPTLVGSVFVIGGLWFGALGPFLEALEVGGVEGIVAGESGFVVNGFLVFGGVIVGYVIHRVGRTALLFYFYRGVLEDELEVPASDDETEPRLVPDGSN